VLFDLHDAGGQSAKELVCVFCTVFLNYGIYVLIEDYSRETLNKAASCNAIRTMRILS
jgi:hypothetical protein